MEVMKTKKIRIAVSILLGVFVGFLLGRFIIYYMAYSIPSLGLGNSCETKPMLYAFLGLIVILTGLFSFMMQKKNRKERTGSPLFAAVLFLLTCGGVMALSYYLRGYEVCYSDCDKQYSYINVYDSATNGYNKKGIIDPWGNLIFEPSYGEVYCGFDNDLHKEVFVSIIPTSSNINLSSHKNGDVVQIKVYDKSGSLLNSYSMEYNDNSKVSLLAFLKKKYGEPLHNDSKYIADIPIHGDILEGLSFPSMQKDNEKVVEVSDEAVAPVEDEEFAYPEYAENYEEEEPKPAKRQQVPMQEWRDCINCFGSGQCPYCYGQGHQINMYGQDQDCPVCTNGNCTMCAGKGGHYEIVYR